MRFVREAMRNIALPLRSFVLNKIWGFDISYSARISFGAYLDKTNPSGVVIGDYSLIARGAVILSHDYSRRLRAKTIIGKNCLVGVYAIILPGVHIGDCSVIGAGAVVTGDLPKNSLAVGNPARVIRTIDTMKYGIIID